MPKKRRQSLFGSEHISILDEYNTLISELNGMISDITKIDSKSLLRSLIDIWNVQESEQ